MAPTFTKEDQELKKALEGRLIGLRLEPLLMAYAREGTR